MESRASTIEAHAKSVRDLLAPKYTIDYYQREYRWETRQVEELLEDLESAFLDSYDASHERPKPGSTEMSCLIA